LQEMSSAKESDRQSNGGAVIEPVSQLIIMIERSLHQRERERDDRNAPEELVQSLDRSLLKRRAKVYPTLREMCLDYAFWPRQQLHIEDLAALLSSSATPVREALARLAGEGLIEALPNRGYVAKALCEDQMRGNLDLLFTLLTDAIARAKPERWPIRAEQGGLDEQDLFRLADANFMNIARLPDNDVLCEHIVRLMEQTRFVRRLYFEDDSGRAEMTEPIRWLRDSLVTHDAMSAKQALDDQIRDLHERLGALIKEGRTRSMTVNRAPMLVRSVGAIRLPTA
jgi:DNA-binding GntR family transcriptional regulator